MKGMKRKISLILAIAVVFSALSVMSSVPSAAAEEADIPSLAEVYKDYFLIGNIFSPNQIPGERFDFMKKHFNALTAENSMKPENMQRSKGNFTFSETDAALEHILAADIYVVGHTLAWHQQSPAFLNKGVTRQQAEENMRDHVMTVAGHYSGKILAWDVLNEAINDGPGNPENWRSALRRTDWYNAFAQDGDGADYIYELFKLAREADPHAILYYNDYNLDTPNKARAVYYMVKELNEKYAAEGNDRLLIEGVGMQGHYTINTSISEVRQSIELFRELGVEISVTELDVGVSGVNPGEGLSEDDEFLQAAFYAQLFALYREHSDVIARVTFWGLNDMASWRRQNFPLIFNADFSPKMAFYAILDPEKFLEENEISQVEIIKRLTGSAAFGTPVIDGEIDDIWESAEILPVDQMLQAWHTASGKSRVLWDNENLYVLVQVSDTELDVSSRQVHEQDSVEIFIDEKNCKQGGYQSEDWQYRINAEGEESFGSTGSAPGFESAVTVSGTSYIVEVKIPLTAITPEEGMILGFDVQINDGRNGSRVGMAKWNDFTNNSYMDTTNWGEIELVGSGGGAADTEAPAEDDEAPAEDTEEPDNTPALADADGEEEAEGSSWLYILIGAGVLLVVAVVVIILVKKRK